MPVSIRKGGKLPSSKIVTPMVTKPGLDPAQLEVFGRLRLGAKHIAQFYNISVNRVYDQMRHPECRAAYEKGRAETVIAIRQKMLSMALAGDTRMLLHAGVHLADQADIPNLYEDDAPEDRTWDGALAARALEVRDLFLKD